MCASSHPGRSECDDAVVKSKENASVESITDALKESSLKRKRPRLTITVVDALADISHVGSRYDIVLFCSVVETSFLKLS